MVWSAVVGGVSLSGRGLVGGLQWSLLARPFGGAHSIRDLWRAACGGKLLLACSHGQQSAAARRGAALRWVRAG